jgi:predicted phosphatase
VQIETNIEDTIFDDYDTVVFDADGTIIDCFSPQGDGIGVYKTNPPYDLKNSNMIIDTEGNIIKLDAGVRDLFKWLDDNDVNIGIVSSGEKENTPLQAQPGMLVLKKFDLKKYINYEVVFKRDINKGDYVKPLGKTLFIDNKDDNLDNVDDKGMVDVLNRGSFENWNDLLKSKTSTLNFSLYKLSQKHKYQDTVDSALEFYTDTLTYSKLKTKQYNNEFLYPDELVAMASIKASLPNKMIRLSNVITQRWKDIKLDDVKENVWNEDRWQYCFSQLDKVIEQIGI